MTVPDSLESELIGDSIIQACAGSIAASAVASMPPPSPHRESRSWDDAASATIGS